VARVVSRRAAGAACRRPARTTEVGIALFKTAFERSIGGGDVRPFAELAGEALAELRALTGAEAGA
jgi:hypothetical protein